jgi:hypothetical protein
MERTTQVIAKIALVLSLFCTMSFAQKSKVAVYVSEQSGYSGEVKNALRVATVNVLVRSGKYSVVERSSVIDEELSRQSSGAVDDDQMVAYGRQAGARYICVSDITDLGSYHVPAQYYEGRMISQSYNRHPHQVSARIIDVETAQLVGLGVIDLDIQGGSAMSAAITQAVEKMLGTIQENVNPRLPKKAVYVQGGRRNNQSGNALYSYTLEALFTRSRSNGDFVVVERSEAFTRQIDREQKKQHSGSVADSDISRMGKQYGISEICIASIELAMGSYSINARLVNVERASVVNASELRHMKSENSASGNLSNLRNIAVQMVEDMIPRQLSEEEIEEDRRIKAKIAEEERAAWMAGAWIGGGVFFNMNDLEPNYFKSLGGQLNIGGEFYKQSFKFIRIGINLDLGLIDVEKDEVSKNMPSAIADSAGGLALKINALLRLYPVDYFFLAGGAGFGSYSAWSKEPKPDNPNELQIVDIVNISTPEFPVGGGLYLGTDQIAFVIEGLYNIIPFKGRTASYISINALLRANFRLTAEKKYEKQEI